MALPLTLAARLAGQPVLLSPGERLTQEVGDTYRDTPASIMTRVIAQIKGGRPWREAVRDKFSQSNPWLCDIVTHPARVRFFEEYPLAPDSLVLDVGAGWGQATLPLAAKHRVVAVEPTPERIEFILAAAEQEQRREKIYFLQASFLDLEFEPIFDYVCCIGVLEWVAQFHREGEPRAVQLAFLRRLRASLRPGGRCLIGIENRLGLKYILGAPDDHIGLPDIGVVDQALARSRFTAATGKELRCFTYSLSEYEELLREAGFVSAQAYAAYPDYKLPQFIAPADATLDAALLSRAFIPEHDGTNGRPLPQEMQETLASHYRSMAQQGVSRIFAPSYFFLAMAAG